MKNPRTKNADLPADWAPKRSRGVFAKRVGRFVPRLTRKAFEKYGFSTAALLTDWANIVGTSLAQHTVPERLKWPRNVNAYGDIEQSDAGRPGATLMLRVDPAHALDVQYDAQQIIERINAYFGYQAIADLRIKQAPVDADQAFSSTAPLKHETNQNQPRPEALADLSDIDDDGLRDALEKLSAHIQTEQPQ